MTVRIVTDSTCDLPAEIAEELGITIIPDFIHAGGTSYQDGVNLTRREFYTRLPEWEQIPTTAAPGLGAFQAVYERLAAAGASAIVCLHPPDRFSNLANVARLAEAAVPAIPVRVVAGGFISLGGGFIAAAAARAGHAGAPLAEVLHLVQDHLSRTFTFAGVATLEYLRRSGRVPHLMARLGSWLQLFPVLKLHRDEIEMDLVRTRSRSVERVIHLVESLGPLERLGVVHSNVPERAQELLRNVAHLLPSGDPPWVVDVTPVLGVHVGPGAVGLAALRASR